MSRLPRLPRLQQQQQQQQQLSSEEVIAPPPTVTMRSNTQSLKRKAEVDDEDNEALEQPRKLPAFPRSDDPQRPTRKLPSRGPAPLTKPRAPNLSTTRRTTRATSAPPKNGPPPRSFGNGRAAAARKPPASSRNVSASASSSSNKQSQNTSSEALRAADAALLEAAMAAERQKVEDLHAAQSALTRDLAATRLLELNHRRELVSVSDEIDALKKQHAAETEHNEAEIRRLAWGLKEKEEDLTVTKSDLEAERQTAEGLKQTMAQQTEAHLRLTTQVSELQAELADLRGNLEGSHNDAASLRTLLDSRDGRIAELEHDLREADRIRRRLHNTIQELKGNIRVFCRVRPILPSEAAGGAGCAQIDYPDDQEHKEITLTSTSESAMGQERKELYRFTFDQVFDPAKTQLDVFEEVSQLAQSCVDGYNVCIFAYGQTGSGKSYTMEGGTTEESKGMIPRAVEEVFQASEHLKGKGWSYSMEGQFLEIYNETINDLLGTGEFDKKKHEIKHDLATSSTRVTDMTVVPLASPAQVMTLLVRAQSRRSTASTLMNERSSRSHSVFTLRIKGENEETGEKCSGCLNLVDLAGSERLSAHGGKEGSRIKETKNINKSLSALGDVIAALGEKSDRNEKHVPYRNSKLTYLLQNSLSGNSKTLMILNLSPLAAHAQESLTSLRFATKVNNTTLTTKKK